MFNIINSFFEREREREREERKEERKKERENEYKPFQIPSK
jgi:hypothetical protein